MVTITGGGIGAEGGGAGLEAARHRGTARWPAELVELATLPAGAAPVLSLYLDLCWDHERRREETRIAAKTQQRRLRADGLAAAIEQEMRRADAIVEAGVNRWEGGGVRGLAMFLAAPIGLERVIATTARLPTLVLVDDRPMLRPLLVARPADRHVLAVAVGSHTGRVYALDWSGARLVAVEETPVTRRQGGGGWSQLKQTHHRTEEIEHHLKNTAQRLARTFFDRGQVDRILVAGRPENVAALMRAMPQALVSRCHALPDALPEEEPAALARLQDLADSIEADEARVLRQALEDEAAAGGRAAVGADVARVARDGRIDHLLLESRYCEDAGACDACSTIVVRDDESSPTPGPCPTCGSALRPTEAGEALVRAAIRNDARVSIVQDAAWAARGGLPIARLRY